MDGSELDATPRVLATDLDGTLIPLEGNGRNVADLRRISQELKRNRVTVVFVTGRHFESALRAIEQFSLPFPEWIICDVGSSIYVRRSAGGYQLVDEYQAHQDDIVASLPISQLQRQVVRIRGLRLQEEEKQGRFKLSFYAPADRLVELSAEVREVIDRANAPYSIIQSVDPFNGDGLIDLLPADVSKAYALQWWAQYDKRIQQQIVFAGDSGNDYAALAAGYRVILVGNADRALARRVYEHHRASNWSNRLFLASEQASSGLLEGLRWYGLADRGSTSREGKAGRLGATCRSHNETHFCVWAPNRTSVEVEVAGERGVSRKTLTLQQAGYFSGTVEDAPPGATYQYILDGTTRRPDPASRFQPLGVHKASMIVNPEQFAWTDGSWKGVPKRQLVIYELHLGTFTEAGSFRAAMDRIPELIDLGITAIELMPVAQSPGQWNWGYDGVDIFAPRNSYGTPDDFRALVDACHANGLAVILDVVYNHLGPEGNYLREFGPYYSQEHGTPWGEAFNFDGPSAEQVRRFIVENVTYWLEEYHLDGLRLDAVHFMCDHSSPSILDEISLAVGKIRREVDRELHLIAESNIYDHDLLTDATGPSYDAIWSDCLMHSIYSHALPDLQLTHRIYLGAKDLTEALEHGYLYYSNDHKPNRAEPETRVAFDGADRSSFVTGLQTHDAVGNHAQGKRLHQLTSKAYQKAAASLVLLCPGIPLIFMGEEAAVESPFPFFVDFEDPALREAVKAGRAREYPQHVWGTMPSPSDPATFRSAKCYDRTTFDQPMIAWYRDLISLRRQGITEGWLSAETLTTAYEPIHHVFSLRYHTDDHQQVLIRARLNDPVSKAAAIKIPLEGRLVLSSCTKPLVEHGLVELQANHAVISRS